MLSEAIVAGVPVLASRISGAIGVMGQHYRGYFEVGNTDQLAGLMYRCETEARFYAALCRQCGVRARLFHPDQEVKAWRRLLNTIGFPVPRS